jgi:hypothetical protein
VWLYRSDLRPLYRAKVAAIRTIRAALRPFPMAIVLGLCYAGAAVLVAQLRLVHLIGIKKRRIVPVWLKASIFLTVLHRDITITMLRAK